MAPWWSAWLCRWSAGHIVCKHEEIAVMAADARQTPRRFTVNVGGHEIIIETGKFAEQAGGAVTVQMGQTMVFATATMSKSAREGIDFFPLSVEYEEKLYAAGRIPGSYFRREGKPSETAILTARVVDRPLRPLFPEDMLNEVQIILNAFSHDGENQIDMLAIIAASAAIMISDIPWNGPIAGVRIGLIDGEFVVNPLISQMDKSSLDLRVAGTADAINMVECAATEVDEATMLNALRLAHESMQPIIALQKQMQAELGKAKLDYVKRTIDPALMTEIREYATTRVRDILIQHTDRTARSEATDALKTEIVLAYDARNLANPDTPIKIAHVKEAFETVIYEQVRHRILYDGVRPDGRDYTTIRPLAAEVGLIPRVHGSGMFKRGQTQVLTIATLGTPRDAQETDSLISPEETKRYLHHYNMPPFSTGETYPVRGPRRREIGHGALAEAALRNMIPDEKSFPYTIRLVSEVLSSNGSTSMASVCGSTLALMDAGVPIKRPVGGIAMGLISDGTKVAVLTDIQGLEDHLGDMDFKVAGTVNGITALQMDIKISGVTDAIMTQALEQARVARMQILDVMLAALPAYRANLSDFAPRMTTVKIEFDKIGMIIGPGGKTIRAMQERHGVKIDIGDDGMAFIAGSNGPAVQGAVDEIRGMTEDAEIGRIYTGKVTRIEPYGVFVEFLPGREGMVHISQLASYRVRAPEDEVHMGDELMVMVTEVNDGKVRLSRQAVLEGWTAEEARERDKRQGGGGGRGGGGGGDRGGRGGGGDRGGRGGGYGNGGARPRD
jgi:polyribonucleotide nucleotidyltransferase